MMDKLDDNLLGELANCLDPKELLACRLVSKDMRVAMTRPQRWMQRCSERAGIDRSRIPVRMSSLLAGIHPLHILQHIRPRRPSGFQCNFFEELQLAYVAPGTASIGPHDSCRDVAPLPGVASRIQYVGGVQGERSVVADEPFPAVIRGGGQRARHAGRTLPFVLPIARPGIGFELIPSVVAYFEVTVEHPHSSWPPIPGSCVAVGLCNRRFPLATTLPGWDCNSYGWHSDDGHVFHSSGHGSPFAERFRPGDVVGCGIDMLPCLPSDDAGFAPTAARIFFTRNGRMEGYAFDDLDVSQPWFPVVGLDSPCPVTFNSGCDPKTPFLFPLTSFIRQQWQVYATTHPGILGVARGRLPAVQSGSPPPLTNPNATAAAETAAADAAVAGVSAPPFRVEASPQADLPPPRPSLQRQRPSSRPTTRGDAPYTRWSSWRSDRSAVPSRRVQAGQQAHRAASRPLAHLGLRDLLLHAKQAAHSPHRSAIIPLLHRLKAPAGNTRPPHPPTPPPTQSLSSRMFAEAERESHAGITYSPALDHTTAPAWTVSTGPRSAREGAQAALALAAMVRMRLRRNSRIHAPSGQDHVKNTAKVLSQNNSQHDSEGPSLPPPFAPNESREPSGSRVRTMVPSASEQSQTGSTMSFASSSLAAVPLPLVEEPLARRRWRLMPDTAHAELGWTGTGALRPAVLARAVEQEQEEAQIRRRRRERRLRRRGEWSAAVLASLQGHLTGRQPRGHHSTGITANEDVAGGVGADSTQARSAETDSSRIVGGAIGRYHSTGSATARAARSLASAAAAAVHAASQPLQEALLEQIQTMIPLVGSSSDSDSDSAREYHASGLHRTVSLPVAGVRSSGGQLGASSSVDDSMGLLQAILQDASRLAGNAALPPGIAMTTSTTPTTTTSSAASPLPHADSSASVLPDRTEDDMARHESLPNTVVHTLLRSTGGLSNRRGLHGAARPRRRDDSVTSLLEAVADAFAGVSGSDSRSRSGRIHQHSASSHPGSRAPPSSPVLSGHDGESGSDPNSSPRLLHGSPTALLRPSLARLDLGQRDYDSDASDMCDDVPVTPAWLADGDAGGVFARQAVTGRVERPAMLEAVEQGSFPGEKRGSAPGRQLRTRRHTAGIARHASPLSRQAIPSSSIPARHHSQRDPKTSAIHVAASPHGSAHGHAAGELISPPWVRGGGALVDLSGEPITVDSD